MKETSSESLSEDAYTWLLSAIASFEIPTNSQISESKLALQLGFSRTPVREALKRLENEGLVTRNEGRYTVAMLTSTDVDNALDVLQMCDTYMFVSASRNLSKEDALSLKAIAKSMSTEAKAGNQEKWMRDDHEFHEIIIRNCSNPLVVDFARITRRRIQRFWANSALATRDLETCADEHLTIAEAVSGESEIVIEKAVAAHLSHLRSNLHEIVAASAPFFGK